MREPLVQTQVLPYIREIMKDGVRFTLLTFEPKRLPEDLVEFETIRRQLEVEGIDWQRLPYHKRFSVLATAWDILRGALFIRSYIARDKPDILHGRVHVPTLMGALARKFSRHKPKLLFDIRGFMPEEYTDAGIWPEGGILYRTAKRVERWLMKEADGFVVLTEKARDILFPESKGTGRDKLGRPVEVIPCCVDLNRFLTFDSDSRESKRRELGIGDRRVFAYVGSFGGWYMTDEMLDFFAVARAHDPNSFVMILTQRDKEMVIQHLKKRGFVDNDYFVGSVTPKELPSYLGAADVAISFIKACYSKQSSSPTKIAEYLACGLPIIANRGVGDVDELLSSNGNGCLVNDFTDEEFIGAISTVAEQSADRVDRVQVAKDEFDLARVGGKRYRQIYRRLFLTDRPEQNDFK